MKNTSVMAFTAVTAAVAAMFNPAQAQLAPVAQSATSLETRQISVNFSRTGIDKAWARGYTGKGVIVAVLDSGFDLGHADLKNSLLKAKNFSEIVVVNTKENKNNYSANIQAGSDVVWSEHGTQMASIIAGDYNGVGTVGVAPDAQLLLAQVGQGLTFSSKSKTWVNNDGGLTMSDSRYNPGTGGYNALTWAELNGAAVANMSFGSQFDPTFVRETKMIATGVYLAPKAYGSMYGNSQDSLMSFAGASKTMVLVTASGNQGLPYAQFPGAYATQVDADGNLLLGGRMLIVGSVDANDQISKFTNRAGHICTNLVNNVCKDPYQVKDFYVVAPGVNQYGSYARQRYANANNSDPAGTSTGTSPAAAYVSGGVALIKQAWPQLTAAQIVRLVTTTATDLGAKGVDEVYGWGMVNFDRATQPQGAVSVANYSVKTGKVTKGYFGIGGAGYTASTATCKNCITTSSILSNTQVVDDYDRHFTADLTKAAGSKARNLAAQTNAWLAIDSEGLRQVTVGNITVATTDQGFAMSQKTPDGYTIEVGSLTESNGFLGNRGQAALALGNSSTAFAVVGREFVVGSDSKISAQYGVGVTRAASVAGSLLAVDSTLVSNTWAVNYTQQKLLADRDSFTVGVKTPVAVATGAMTVTAVTDYKFSAAGEDVVADSVVSKERHSLRPENRPLDLTVSYSQELNRSSQVSLQLVQEFAQDKGNTDVRLAYHYKF
jgi:subtilisin family serine protease